MRDADDPPASGQSVERPADAGQSGWNVHDDENGVVVALTGDWLIDRHGLAVEPPDRIVADRPAAIGFDASGLGRWDSALIAFLLTLIDAARSAKIPVDLAGVPEPARRLLDLASAPVADEPARRSPPFVERIGRRTLGVAGEAREFASLIGLFCLRVLALLRGKAAMRTGDLFQFMLESGLSALPIVTVVNFLVGSILAFVGAIQLRAFGADIYVASLVGIGMTREMAALMTAIIMAGRTGGAFAANLATMQGNEEIDALQTVGIPVFDYLVLPRVLALTLMIPILYLYACAIGIIGGTLIAMLTLKLSAAALITQTRLAVTGTQFGIGLAKSVAFGFLIAVVGCRVGLAAGRSAAEVGNAATGAVVMSVVGVIALDAIYAFCTNALGI